MRLNQPNWIVFLNDFENLRKLNSKFDSSTPIRSHLGSGSGGYAENIYRMISIVVFSQEIPLNTKLNFEMKRNKRLYGIRFNYKR